MILTLHYLTYKKWTSDAEVTHSLSVTELYSVVEFVETLGICQNLSTETPDASPSSNYMVFLVIFDNHLTKYEYYATFATLLK